MSSEIESSRCHYFESMMKNDNGIIKNELPEKETIKEKSTHQSLRRRILWKHSCSRKSQKVTA